MICRWSLRLLLPLLLASAAPLAAQTIVDRIAAIVGDQVITLSDVRVARDFGLVDASPARAGGDEPAPDAARSPVLTEAQVLERLVERELMRAEVERFGSGELAPDTEARIQAARARFPSIDAFRAALEAHGFTEARFGAWVADDARIEQYVKQRFGASAQPTDEEALQYYQSREREFAVGGRPQPFEEVREQVRQRLADTRRQAMVDDWVSGLRRRAAVVMKSID
jgi:hypothetical protein